MTVLFSATFEFDAAAPVTVTGTVSAAQMTTCFARAARMATRQAPRQAWRSMVLVIERAEAAGAEAAA